MSVCSNFVEHVWKPDSCKNCFYPKRSHRLHASLELEASSLPLRNLNGIRSKAEETPLEGECVIASPYSKPTIAVKPTMINLDVSDVWADVNMNADISQVMINKGCGILQCCSRYNICFWWGAIKIFAMTRLLCVYFHYFLFLCVCVCWFF